ncbi:membrane protein [Salmonella phage vB_SalM_SA002]|nr:membrane protein [Salmonella phage vB_SalM_SA002]
MKRTKNINHDRFRKVRRYGTLTMALMAVSGAFVMTGCDEPADQPVAMYKNSDDCVKANPSETEQCNKAWQRALQESDKTGPKYNSQGECTDEFGYGQCYQTHSSGGGMVYMPYPGGFMYGNHGSYSQPLYSSSRPSSPMYRSFSDASGHNYGSSISGRNIMTTRSNIAPKAATTSTVTRGGFGRSVSSHASFGG